MGLGVNLGALLVGLAAFAGWTLSRFAVPRFVRWVNLLEGAGILTLLFSLVAPNHGFQQELMRPPTPSARVVCAHTRVAPRRSPVNLSINAFVKAEAIWVPTASCSFLRDQPLKLTHFHAPTPIHSPPVASLAALGLRLYMC